MCGATIRYAKEENFKPSVQSILDCVNRKTKIVFLGSIWTKGTVLFFKNAFLLVFTLLI